MNDLMVASPPTGCQAGQLCDRAPCFQARLQATADGRRVRRHADICACHLGGTVQALAAWARHQRLTGTVTVLAIDHQYPRPADGRSSGGSQMLRGFAFGTIILGKQAGGPLPGPSGRADSQASTTTLPGGRPGAHDRALSRRVTIMARCVETTPALAAV